MGKTKVAKHTARRHIQSSRQANTQKLFAPTVSIERPIVWEDEAQKKSYLKNFNKALGKSLPHHKHQHHIVRPEQLRVVQLREQALAEQNVELHRYDQRAEMAERLAYLLQERLNELLKGTPDMLPLYLGDMACFTEPSSSRSRKKLERPVMGIIPLGWQGFRQKYPEQDTQGNKTATRQLALEGKVIKKSLQDVNPYLRPNEIIADPRLIVLENSNPNAWRDLDTIEASMAREEVLADIPMLGDPILTLRTGWLPRDIIELPIRQPETLISPLAAVS